jgi:hypothetical protein
MNGNVNYSAAKDDLLSPCKNAEFFAMGAPPFPEAALCAELSRLAYCRTAEDNFSLNRTRISDELNRVGFKVQGWFESRGTPEGRGTHCFLAVSQNPGLAVVAFRGTDADDPTDVAHDAEAQPVSWDGGRGKVHWGFWAALREVRKDLLDVLGTVPRGGRLLFTGHSLGAALATLLAGMRQPDALFTFGSPRVGDEEFVATIDENRNYRYVDCCDIVTRVPPEGFGYQHLGKPYYIFQNRTIGFDPTDNEMRVDRLAAFLEYPIKYHAWRRENVGVRELADHAPVNYVSAVFAAPPPNPRIQQASP